MDDTPEPQDATERLRSRLAGRPIALTPPPRRSVVPWVLAAIFFVFALGLIANPWFEANIRDKIPGIAAATQPGGVDMARLAQLEQRLSAAETRSPAPAAAAAAATPQANERVAALEARIDGLERSDTASIARMDTLTSNFAALTGRVDANAGQTVLTLQAARVDADRAQAALSVLAARRAVEAGRWSPGLATPLRTLFGNRQGPAVEAVIALGSAPVTTAALRDGIGRLRGNEPVAKGSWWQNLTSGLSSIVEVRERRATTDSDPLSQADAAMAAGDLPRAVAAVERLPRGPGVTAWLAAAQRWQAGMRGLSTLEEAALTLQPVPALPAL